MRKRKLILVFNLCLLLGLSFTACQKTPEKEAIRQKGDINQVIQDNQAKKAEGSTENNISTVIAAPSKENFDLKSENGKVDILVDAGVMLPEASEAPVIRINRKDFQDKDIETLCRIFFGDEEIYKEKTEEDMTKDELLEQIANVQKMMEETGKENKELSSRKLQPYIERLQSLLDTAPDTYEPKPIKEFKFPEPDNTYGANSSVFMASGELNKITGHILVQKGDAYNNCSFYLDNPEGSMCYTRNDVISMDGEAAADMKTECKYSEEEAVKLCEEIVQKLGREKEYFLYSVDPTARTLPSAGGDSYEGYRIKFSRKVGSLQETADNFNLADEIGCLDTVPYAYERMDFVVGDYKVESFTWDSPMETGETIADNVNLLTYKEIIEIFKQQVLLQYADTEEAKKLHITEIRLGLMRVKNKDDQNSFTLTPVWDFIQEENGKEAILTINAVDGSIMNRSLGY